MTRERGVIRHSETARRDRSSSDKSTYLTVRRGDLAYNSMRMWQGVSGLVGEDGIVSPAYTVLAPRPGNDPQFLSFLLRYRPLVDVFRAYSQGLVDDTLTLKFSELAGLPALLPPLAEQRKIAAILSSVDETIEKTEDVIAQLDVVKKAMLEELLTRGIPGRHSRFKQTEIGEVPEEWRVESLRKLLREPIRNGYSPVCPKTPTGRWILHLGSVTFDGFDPTAVKPAPPDDARVDLSRLEVGDLLVSRSNTQERVGLAGVYGGEPTPCSYPDLLMRVRPRAELDVRFLELALLSGMGRAYFERTSRGTSGSMKKIDRAILESFPIAVPNVAEQSEIVAIASSTRARLRAEETVLASLAESKAGLSAALLTGRVRVPA